MKFLIQMDNQVIVQSSEIPKYIFEDIDRNNILGLFKYENEAFYQYVGDGSWEKVTEMD